MSTGNVEEQSCCETLAMKLSSVGVSNVASSGGHLLNICGRLHEPKPVISDSSVTKMSGVGKTELKTCATSLLSRFDVQLEAPTLQNQSSKVYFETPNTIETRSTTIHRTLQEMDASLPGFGVELETPILQAQTSEVYCETPEVDIHTTAISRGLHDYEIEGFTLQTQSSEVYCETPQMETHTTTIHGGHYDYELEASILQTQSSEVYFQTPHMETRATEVEMESSSFQSTPCTEVNAPTITLSVNVNQYDSRSINSSISQDYKSCISESSDFEFETADECEGSGSINLPYTGSTTDLNIDLSHRVLRFSEFQQFSTYNTGSRLSSSGSGVGLSDGDSDKSLTPTKFVSK